MDDAHQNSEEYVAESLSKEIFSTYVCWTIDRGHEHPADVAEARSLSAVPLPSTSYPLWDTLPEDIISNGRLSKLQLEGILYACSKHQEILPNGERAGFFIGDGAGIGKGRQVAGIILDNYARGRRRHVWVSLSSDLHLDAERDLRDIGCYARVINNCQALDRESRALGLSRDYQEGVLFLTYATLISVNQGKSRLEQVVSWLGGESFDGCLVFDECHKAKNFVPGKEAQSSKVSGAVLALQRRLPHARVVYASATGVSEVGHMAYMDRMGLWGKGTAFNDFEDFLESMKKRGVSFLEMLAMEMKAEGKYVARGLAYTDAEFMELEVKLGPEQVQLYESAARVWQLLRARLTDALLSAGITRGDMWHAFWATQQRFFKLLCVSLKVDTVVAEAKAALAAGQCVVIGLQSTGEAAGDAMSLTPGPLDGWVSPTKEMLLRFVEVHFPTRQHVEAKDGPVGEGPQLAECVSMRQEVIRAIANLQLPPNFLDLLVDLLGGTSKVAEMTGRRGRIVRGKNGRLQYEVRGVSAATTALGADVDSLNVRERDAFMRGEKLVAIISDAASTGISLHASRDVANKCRRVHLTIELPWSADKAIQQLGRSHRSNQASAPLYKLVLTCIGGEKRFGAAVARRLQSLGALTRGDRRAASGLDMSGSNYDSPLGRRALRRMYDAIVLESSTLASGVKLSQVMKGMQELDAASAAALFDTEDRQVSSSRILQLHSQLRQYCDIMGIGLDTAHTDSVAEEKAGRTTGSSSAQGDVRRFLNRLLGLPVASQNLLFSYFNAVLEAEVQGARAEGRYAEGLTDVMGSNISLSKRRALWVDPVSGLKTYVNTFDVDRGLDFETACARLEHAGTAGGSGFYRARRPLYGMYRVLLALAKPGQRNIFSVSRPNTGDSHFDMEQEELQGRYVPLDVSDAEGEWRAQYIDALEHCLHGPNCGSGAKCTMGRRVSQVTVVSGSVVRVWGVLEEVMERHAAALPREERSMRVVRVEVGSAQAPGHSARGRDPLPSVTNPDEGRPSASPASAKVKIEGGEGPNRPHSAPAKALVKTEGGTGTNGAVIEGRSSAVSNAQGQAVGSHAAAAHDDTETAGTLTAQESPEDEERVITSAAKSDHAISDQIASPSRRIASTMTAHESTEDVERVIVSPAEQGGMISDQIPSSSGRVASRISEGYSKHDASGKGHDPAVVKAAAETNQGSGSRREVVSPAARPTKVSSVVGVRYPASLLPEVVAVLQSLQVIEQANSRLSGSSAAAARRAVVEPITPVDSRSLAKALRAPTTLKDFFKPVTASSARADETAGGDGNVKAVVKQEPRALTPPPMKRIAHSVLPFKPLTVSAARADETAGGDGNVKAVVKQETRALTPPPTKRIAHAFLPFKPLTVSAARADKTAGADGHVKAEVKQEPQPLASTAAAAAVPVSKPIAHAMLPMKRTAQADDGVRTFGLQAKAAEKALAPMNRQFPIKLPGKQRQAAGGKASVGKGGLGQVGTLNFTKIASKSEVVEFIDLNSCDNSQVSDLNADLRSDLASRGRVATETVGCAEGGEVRDKGREAAEASSRKRARVESKTEDATLEESSSGGESGRKASALLAENGRSTALKGEKHFVEESCSPGGAMLPDQDKNIEQLLGMGFSTRAAERALWATKGNLQGAVDMLLARQ